VALRYLLLPGDRQEICSVELTHMSIKHSSTCRDSRTKSPSYLVAIPLSSFGASQKECDGKTCRRATIASLENNRKTSSRQPRLDFHGGFPPANLEFPPHMRQPLIVFRHFLRDNRCSWSEEYSRTRLTLECDQSV
jgi:hypothetical protein